MASTHRQSARAKASEGGSAERVSLPGAAQALERVRKIALAFPEAGERLSHGSPTFFIGGKKTFATFVDNHHRDGRLAIWCAAPPGAQEALLAADPERTFYPQYVGFRGWIGVRLDRKPDWREVRALLEEAYCAVAPAKLAAQLADRRFAQPRVHRHP